MTTNGGSKKKITIKTKAKTVIERGRGKSKVAKTDSSELEQTAMPADANQLHNAQEQDPPEYRSGNSKAPVGRIAATIARGRVEWFIPDLIPKSSLTLLVGQPGAGKSTMGAWICAAAKRPAVLPGYEESVEAHLLPRLAVNQVPLDQCLILDGRSWSVPNDRDALTRALRAHKADLLWIDPVDSYTTETKENDGPGVRTALESLVRIALDVPCCVVAARHPGKDPKNVCPASRQWRAVPRQILLLTIDDGPPERRFMRCYKPAVGRGFKPREYQLIGPENEAGRFVLGSEANPSDIEVSEVSDRVDRWKIEQAEELLRGLLAESEQESVFIYSAAEKERLGDRLVRKAAERLGVMVRRQGVGREHRSIWFLPTPATPAHPQRDTQGPETSAEDGVTQTGGRSSRSGRSSREKGG